ncbi:hypothetical protein F5Y05DRAFT_409320 [Hypoxylon sp. FL0543]|nr:hypothetical protein F5Y05DRAFT_409320 [Hypoxylon sp. FL0543]
MPALEQSTAERTEARGTIQPDLSQSNHLSLQPEHPPSSPSSSSSLVSSPISHTTTITASSPSSSTDTLSNVEAAALPPRPSTPRTRRFQGDFLTLLTLLPAGRYPGPPSPPPSSPGRSPYSVAAASDNSGRDENDAGVEQYVDDEEGQEGEGPSNCRGAGGRA